LVPIGNAAFARRVLVNSSDLKETILPDGDHFILWNRYPVVREAIVDMLGKR
jgi:hypothetical protein